MRYDNGTDAEVELAFDENVSAVRALNVSTVDGDANLTESVSVSRGRVVATVDGTAPDELTVAYDVADDAGNRYATEQAATVRSAAVTTGAGDDDTVYEGSTLAVLTDRTNTSVAVDAADGSVSRSESTGANSKAYLLDTGTLDRGAYDVVYGGDANRNATFRVESLGLTVGVADATVTNDDGATVAATVSADAGGRSVAVELRDADGNAVAADAAVLDGRGEYDYAFDASGLGAGDYAVLAVDGPSGAEKRSEPVVVSDPPSDDSDDGGDDDSEYGDYRDPTPTPTETTLSPTSTERSTADAGPVAGPSDGRDAAGVEFGENAEERETAVDAASPVNGVTEGATTDAAASPTTTEAAPVVASGTESETATGTGVPGFGVGAAAAALFLGAMFAVLTARRDR
ncbi:hypothetical protein [Halogeometricum luteum]|uniref:PGF-CTERM protein n=1 Tax=Halogeometricum luteum TaxID=2950537 RepID=A0ABU2FY02_9EURY|nr:hypothetical protein [Halogeometricum sp. S3BR5-2]MDS0293390.1 hypothetical protein [Halogeometricum sp. S3BR5-2]